MTSRTRRAMKDSAASIARRTQAARDALRRRQKEKKARIVKRHVRYKQKQKLLSQLELNEREEPIVAPELLRFDDEEEDGAQQEQTDVKDTTDVNPSVSNEDIEGKEDFTPEEANGGDTTHQVKSKKKYIPFAKERKEFEEMKKKHEQEEKQRQERINRREAMLKSSKKRRKEQAKQFRAVTHRGQPKMKHRVDALLARIERQ